MKTIFTSGRNSKNLICRNKSKLLASNFPGVYQLNCTCNAMYLYILAKLKIRSSLEP